MERRDPKNGTGQENMTEHMQYNLQAKEEYKTLMKEFEFRCRRAAMMNYHVAAGYDRIVFWMQIVSASCGAMSLADICGWFLYNWLSGFEGFLQLDPLGMLGVVIAFLVYLFSSGSFKLIPSMSQRAESHIAAAAAWQRLAQKTSSYMIRLDDPKNPADYYSILYEGLTEAREKICVMVNIPKSTYENFSDPALVHKKMRTDRLMFLKYRELEDQNLQELSSDDENST